jgi:hypothetical protein
MCPDDSPAAQAAQQWLRNHRMQHALPACRRAVTAGGGYMLAVLDNAGRVIETIGPFGTPTSAATHARAVGIGDVRVVPHRPVAPGAT